MNTTRAKVKSDQRKPEKAENDKIIIIIKQSIPKIKAL